MSSSASFRHVQMPEDQEGSPDEIWQEEQASDASNMDCRECGGSVDIQRATLPCRSCQDKQSRELLERWVKAEGGLVDAAGLLERDRVDMEDLPF